MQKTFFKNTVSLTACLLFIGLPIAAEAMVASAAVDNSVFVADPVVPFEATQSNGMTLSQAVESVRRRGNVERVISAHTKVSGGREVHHIKVLTKDGKVRTHTVQGQKR